MTQQNQKINDDHHWWSSMMIIIDDHHWWSSMMIIIDVVVVVAVDINGSLPECLASQPKVQARCFCYVCRFLSPRNGGGLRPPPQQGGGRPSAARPPVVDSITRAEEAANIAKTSCLDFGLGRQAFWKASVDINSIVPLISTGELIKKSVN